MNLFESISDKELNQVIFADHYALKKRDAAEKLAIRDKWLKKFLYSSYNFPENSKGSVLFFRSLQRDDYKKFVHTVICASNISNPIIVEDYLSDSSQINMHASRFLAENLKVISRLQIPDPVERACCAINLCHYGFIVEQLRKFEFDSLVCFSDMQPVEHLASLFFKRSGKITVTLQHGLYIDYGDIDTVNVINYNHQPSEYFLAWGKNTSDLINKHHSDANVVICGKPDLKYPSGDEIQTSSGPEHILVILDQEIFQSQNVSMLRVAKEFSDTKGLEVRVRFHPHSNRAFYLGKFPDLTEQSEISGAYLSIGHTSSLLYELISKGLPVAQFATEIPTIPIGQDCRFTNAIELAQAASNCRGNSPSKNISSIIEVIDSESENRYRNFFSKLLRQASRPMFSLIVPCYNSDQHIMRCLDSVARQSFEDYEIIIIEGAAGDWTLPIATTYADKDPRIRIYSAPDTGVYDAMNKGIARARGEWLYFLGSDDEFADTDVLRRIDQFAAQNPVDMIYGNVRVVGDVKWAKDGTIYDGKFTTEKIQKQNICHQAMFFRNSVVRKYGPFQTKYKLCADWDLNLKIWANCKCRYIDMVVSLFNAGGESTDGSDPEFGRDFAANKRKYFRLDKVVQNAS